MRFMIGGKIILTVLFVCFTNDFFSEMRINLQLYYPEKPRISIILTCEKTKKQVE